MYKLISKRIVVKLFQANKIKSEDLELYEYSFELLISTIVSLLTIFLLSLLVGEFISSFIFIFSFIFLRLCCGGYHAKSHLTCFLTTITNYFLFLIALMLFSKINVNIIHILNIFSFILLTIFSPSENEYNPLSSSEKKKHKRNSALVSATICVICFIVNIFSPNLIKYIYSASIGLLSATISMILGRIEYRIKSNSDK